MKVYFKQNLWSKVENHNDIVFKHPLGVIYRCKNEKGKHGQKLEYFFASKYWKKLNNIAFSVTGIYNTKCPEKELIFNI